MLFNHTHTFTSQHYGKIMKNSSKNALYFTFPLLLDLENDFQLFFFFFFFLHDKVFLTRTTKWICNKKKRSKWRENHRSIAPHYHGFRSSIVKNENATEKGMAKKSWKHFSQNELRSKIEMKKCCFWCVEWAKKPNNSESSWGRLFNVVEATIYFMLACVPTSHKCMCGVFMFFD